MQLSSGTLYWPAAAEARGRPALLDRDLSCDALIVGAGVSGAMAAAALASAGVDTMVIDRRGIAQGSTPASTALIMYELDLTLNDLGLRHGADIARRIYQCCHRAVEELPARLERMGVRCDLERAGSLYLASADGDVAALAAEASARRAIGIDCEFLDRASVQNRFALNRPAALASSSGLKLDPVKLTQNLLDSCGANGARFFTAEVKRHERTSAGFRIHLDNGKRIDARQLVVAAGYESAELFPAVAGLGSLRSTYALVTRPQRAFPDWMRRTLLWETARPYVYGRSTPDDRLIFGGEDESAPDGPARDTPLEQKITLLQQKARRMFPQIDPTAAFAWTGTFGESVDGVPFIGEMPGQPGLFFILGYGGNGITFSALAAGIIADAVRGLPNPDADLFRLDRLQ